MTDNDDTSGRLRAQLDAAMGPTPPARDRMQALTSRYDSWRRRRALTAAGAGLAAVAAVVSVGFAIAVGPGKSAHQPGNQISVAPTTDPGSGSPSGPPAPSASAPTSAPPASAGQTVPPAAAASTTTRTPAAPGLGGTVVDETGKPLAGIYVTGFDGMTQTDSKGVFVAPTSRGRHGGCLLFSSQPLSRPQSGAPGTGDYAWQQWTPPSGDCAQEALADVHVVMHPGADVFGTVRDNNGAPVAGLAVYSTLGAEGRVFLGTSCCGVSFGAVTDSAGHYRIYGEQPGRTTVALRQPWAPGGSGGHGYPATAGSGQPVDLTDFGSNCDSTFPDPTCPNASPTPTQTTPPVAGSPPASPSP
jgi:hypothetical protein